MQFIFYFIEVYIIRRRVRGCGAPQFKQVFAEQIFVAANAVVAKLC
jgi:hypothetical protein